MDSNVQINWEWERTSKLWKRLASVLGIYLGNMKDAWLAATVSIGKVNRKHEVIENCMASCATCEYSIDQPACSLVIVGDGNPEKSWAQKKRRNLFNLFSLDDWGKSVRESWNLVHTFLFLLYNYKNKNKKRTYKLVEWQMQGSSTYVGTDITRQ